MSAWLLSAFFLPILFLKFQGGAFDAWGPNAPGYPNCQILTGADFEDVFYKTLWAANAKLINFYMIFGSVLFSAKLCTA